MSKKSAARRIGLIALAGLSALGCAGDGSMLDDMMGPTGPEPTLAWETYRSRFGWLVNGCEESA